MTDPVEMRDIRRVLSLLNVIRRVVIERLKESRGGKDRLKEEQVHETKPVVRTVGCDSVANGTDQQSKLPSQS